MRRRAFLGTLAGGLLWPWASRALAAAAKAGGRLPEAQYFSARAGGMDEYFLGAFDAAGRFVYDVPLPGRGHGIALRPGLAEGVLVARRPGRFLVVFAADTGEVLYRLDSREDRHFSGHGLYSQDGRWLYTSEIDYDGGRGVIGVRDVAAAYRQVDEFGYCGVEPHDLHLCRDGCTLVIANGGILTHPVSGRAKLNLDSMSSSLVYLEANSGRLLAEHRLPEERRLLSLRHLSVPAPDRVFIAMQYQGPSEDRLPLVALHQAGEEQIRLLDTPVEVLAQMRNYCGSVCADSSGRWVAVSSPQGNTITFWSAAEGSYRAFTRVPDGCGIAAGDQEGEFLLSSGGGALFRYDAPAAVMSMLGAEGWRDAHWDNHMLRREPESRG